MDRLTTAAAARMGACLTTTRHAARRSRRRTRTVHRAARKSRTVPLRRRCACGTEGVQRDSRRYIWERRVGEFCLDCRSLALCLISSRLQDMGPRNRVVNREWRREHAGHGFSCNTVFQVVRERNRGRVPGSVCDVIKPKTLAGLGSHTQRHHLAFIGTMCHCAGGRNCRAIQI